MLWEAQMAKATLNTRNWKAWENQQPPGPPRLHVTGEVETSNGNQTPHLAEASPQGINPEILLLDLTITMSGVGITVMGWKEVRFEKQVSKGQYTSVDIRADGETVGKADVKIVE
jgi:hypothetical protein